MEFAGTFHYGVVVVDDPKELRKGMRLRVIPIEPVPGEWASDPRPLADLLEYAGTVNDLPSDMAAQHDHYIHRMPN